MYGYCVDLPTHTSSHTSASNTTPSDFWAEHENEESVPKMSGASFGNTNKSRNASTDVSGGPNVCLADTVNEGTAKEYKPSLIGNKKPNVRKGVNINDFV